MRRPVRAPLRHSQFLLFPVQERELARLRCFCRLAALRLRPARRSLSWYVWLSQYGAFTTSHAAPDVIHNATGGGGGSGGPAPGRSSHGRSNGYSSGPPPSTTSTPTPRAAGGPGGGGGGSGGTRGDTVDAMDATVIWPNKWDPTVEWWTPEGIQRLAARGQLPNGVELNLHLEQRRSNATDQALQWLLQPARHKEFCVRKVRVRGAGGAEPVKALEFLIFGPDLQGVSLKGTRFRFDCLRMVALGLTESQSILEIDLEDARIEGEAFMARRCIYAPFSLFPRYPGACAGVS